MDKGGPVQDFEPAGSSRRIAMSSHLLMVVAVFIFSANYVVARGVYEDCPPFTLGFTRWTGASLILLPFVYRALRAEWPLVRANWKFLTAGGLLMPFLGAGLSYVALRHTSAVNASVVQTAMPVMIILIAWVVLKERFTFVQAAGTVVALVGVLGIILRGEPALLSRLDLNKGDLLLLVSNVGLAGYAVLLKTHTGISSADPAVRDLCRRRCVSCAVFCR